MMKNIKFCYNKYSPSVLYVMVLFGVAIGFLLYDAVLLFSGVLREPEFVPAYFKEHPDHAVYLIFGLLSIAMFLPTWIAIKCWSSKEEEAALNLYENYAVFYFKNKEMRIEKGTLHIKTQTPRLHWYTVYILEVPQQKAVLVSSVKEYKSKRTPFLSLDVAMDALSTYAKAKKGKKREPVAVDFYAMNIVLGVTNPLIFDDSPYYLDYESMVTIPDASFVTCMIRERRNPPMLSAIWELISFFWKLPSLTSSI